MADYALLKALINANIKANNKQEITGPILNGILQAMVTNIGSGYTFMGVAAPTTDPGTPDHDVVYLAKDAGTYSHFGGLVIEEDGLYLLSLNDTTWTASSLATAPEVYVATYGEDTSETIEEMMEANKVVICYHSDKAYYLTKIASSIAYFVATDGATQRVLTCDAAGQWSSASVVLENTANKASEDVNDGAKYPSSAVLYAVKVALQAAITAEEAARIAADTALGTRIDNISIPGRFLSSWNCGTGLAGDNPAVSPYTYKTGDFYIVGAVASGSGANYRPSGTQYVTGQASTEVEMNSVKVGDLYKYTVTGWVLVTLAEKTVNFANIGGNPSDNTALAAELNNRYTKSTAYTAALESGITAALVAKIHDREIFEASYGVTTYAEITAALAAGKTVTLEVGSNRGILTYASGSEQKYYFACVTSYLYLWSVDSSNTWSQSLGSPIELKTSKVNDLSGEVTNAQYPSALAVKNYSQPVISDLAAIRSGAAAGATAVQPAALAAYRTAAEQAAIDATKQDNINIIRLG